MSCQQKEHLDSPPESEVIASKQKEYESEKMSAEDLKKYWQEKREQVSKEEELNDTVTADNCNHWLKYGTPGKYGVETAYKSVNFALESGGKDKYNYDQIVMGEIGYDNIKSQSAYCEQILTGSNLRLMDTAIETNYANYQGISLANRTNAKVANTMPTQSSGIDHSEIRGPGGLGDYFSNNPY